MSQPTPAPRQAPDELMAELLALLRSLAPTGSAITPQTHILADLDFDSLKMIELIDTLTECFGVDFLQEPNSLASLKSPETLAAALGAAKR